MRAALRDAKIVKAGGRVGIRAVPRIVPRWELHRQRSRAQRILERIIEGRHGS